LEAYALSKAEEKTKDQQAYYMKGIPIHAYLSENGEFRWVPATVACSSKENTKDILEVLKKMPEDRRIVWTSRLDRDQTKTSCPILRDNTDICQEFDEFCAAYDKPIRKNQEKTKGVTQ
jgi:hypothetical protein